MPGSGPLAEKFRNQPGVRDLGFLQADEYAETLKQVGVFILPSYYDPWPLVIHETTSAGLPIICSYQCGSSVELVQEGVNGFLFEAGDIQSLTKLMQFVSKNVDLPQAGKQSYVISQRYNPKFWAHNLMMHLERHNK